MSSQDDRVRELESKLEEALAAVLDRRVLLIAQNRLLRRLVIRCPSEPLARRSAGIPRRPRRSHYFEACSEGVMTSTHIVGRAAMVAAVTPQRCVPERSVRRASGQIRPFSYRSTIAW